MAAVVPAGQSHFCSCGNHIRGGGAGRRCWSPLVSLLWASQR